MAREIKLCISFIRRRNYACEPLMRFSFQESSTQRRIISYMYVVSRSVQIHRFLRMCLEPEHDPVSWISYMSFVDLIHNM